MCVCVCVCYKWGYIFFQIDNNLWSLSSIKYFSICLYQSFSFLLFFKKISFAVSPHYLIFPFLFSMCFLDSGKTPLPPYSKSVETLGQKCFFKMIQEVERPRLTLRWTKNNLRMGTEVWGIRCLWGAGVLSLQSCPIHLCVCVCLCVWEYTYRYTYIHRYFFWLQLTFSLDPGKGKNFLKQLF